MMKMRIATKGYESDLVQVFFITECTGVHEPPLVSILAVLQRFVVAVLFAAYRAHVSMIFIKMKIILMKSSANSFQSVRWRKYTWLVHDVRLQYGPESQGYTRTLDSLILVKYIFETKTFKWCEFTAVMVHPGSGQWCRTVFSWTLFRWLVSVFWPFNRIPQMWQGTVGASCKLSTCFFML